MSKKIAIVSQNSKVTEYFPMDCQIEIVSSIQFLDSVLYGFVPDLIVVDSIYDIDVLQIRKNKNFFDIPLLILSENLSFLTKFFDLLNFPRIMLCSTNFLENPKIKKRIEKILESKQSFLPPKTSALVKLSQRFIGERFGENLTREMISKNVKTSCDYLSRIFKTELGLNLWDYVLLVRLNEAKILLEHSGLSVKEISQKTGFHDPAYFNRMFHREFNISPGKIRIK